MTTKKYLSKCKPKIVLIVCCFFAAFSMSGQDPVFTQFYAAPLQLNPAFAGNTYAPFIALNHRREYPSLNNAYITTAASYDQFITSLNSGIGFSVLSDDAGNGIYNRNLASLYFAYRLQMAKDLFIKLGVEGTVAQSRLNWDKLVFFDQIDEITGPTAPDGTPNPTHEQRPDNLVNNYFDVSAGMLLYNSHFYAGFTARHLTTPNDNIININNQLNTGLPVRWMLHGGYEFVLREGNKTRQATFISPNLLFAKQGNFSQLNVGVYGGLNMIFGGLWYRHTFSNPDAVMALLGFRYGVFKLGYSYDYTISTLGNNRSGGSHEISVIFNFDVLYDRKKPDYNDCFKMFR